MRGADEVMGERVVRTRGEAAGSSTTTRYCGWWASAHVRKRDRVERLKRTEPPLSPKAATSPPWGRTCWERILFREYLPNGLTGFSGEILSVWGIANGRSISLSSPCALRVLVPACEPIPCPFDQPIGTPNRPPRLLSHAQHLRHALQPILTSHGFFVTGGNHCEVQCSACVTADDF